ncbi:MAG: hypothetical protein FJZ43_03500 [Candidatus Staskawiczbacteria bacterium]|nr:hypothetical protein [Candidatus Staskawiczbacteria bacterium]
MPRQVADLINGEVYHICCRAVGDSVIFKNNDDYYRGIFSIYEFNDVFVKTIRDRRRSRLAEKKKENMPGLRHLASLDKRDKLVEVLTFCFMSNHMHLLVKQLKENGISKFIKKVCGGYANYFNKKYGRKGHLFNQFKAIHIENDNQLRNIVTYIHCNPISLIESGWKEKGIKDFKKVINFLKNDYRWTSLWDYEDKQNFHSVIEKDLLLRVIGAETMKKGLENWISYKSEVSRAIIDYENLFLE